ncbi:MAG: FHA domain-containing protein [Gemmatales bacterium]|nr:FHA domain-containing protein [Gemmatales bacterium]MDW7994428.1 FHA domain-containing protein [Gemmatales bacterium]
MRRVTFQVIDGVDKGRIFRDLSVPFTIGREEGNPICLNDERVSRCHLKVVCDRGDVVLLDLDSTNGTMVNGKSVTVCRLEIGDCIRIGRTSLLFGSPQEIAQLLHRARDNDAAASTPLKELRPQTAEGNDEHVWENSADLLKRPEQASRLARLLLERTDSPPPPPTGLSPQQSARLVNFLEFVHERLARCSRDAFYHTELGNHVVIPQHAWHDLLDLQMFVARYIVALTEPQEWEELR